VNLQFGGNCVARTKAVVLHHDNTLQQCHTLLTFLPSAEPADRKIPELSHFHLDPGGGAGIAASLLDELVRGCEDEPTGHNLRAAPCEVFQLLALAPARA
jgi:hypothetical protein